MSASPLPDPYAILKTLGVQTVHAVAQVTGGTDTALWRVEHDHQTSALRVFRSTQGAIYQRELAAMEVAARNGIPVPTIRATAFWHERPAVLLSWCEGYPLAKALRQQPWQLLRLGRTFGQLQAAIHRIHDITLPNTASTDWITWYQAVDRDLEVQLRKHARPVQHLLHLDYHPLNVMMHHHGISCVLDWANARTGDPRADVARTYTILAVEPHFPGREPIWYQLIRRLLAQSWLYGYQTIAGKLSAMPLFFAWAGAVMRSDLAGRVDNPNSWWRPHHLASIERWTQQWRQHIPNQPT
jgi:Ser/Thr protein kinase RdoA (MazF antagonist)